MQIDVFGDLRDWGRVLDDLEGLREQDRLSEHQAGLARLIRYRDNWRLQQEALRSIPDIDAPSPLLLEAALLVLTDPETLLENRVYAAEALSSMLATDGSSDHAVLDRDIAVEAIQAVLDRGCPPILQGVLQKSISIAQQNRAYTPPEDKETPRC
jgi:hypothetical protein